VSALDLLHLARAAAARAGTCLRSIQRPADPGRWTLKGSRDFVTEVDRTADQFRDVSRVEGYQEAWDIAAGNPAIHGRLIETLNANQ